MGHGSWTLTVTNVGFQKVTLPGFHCSSIRKSSISYLLEIFCERAVTIVKVIKDSLCDKCFGACRAHLFTLVEVQGAHGMLFDVPQDVSLGGKLKAAEWTQYFGPRLKI